jgi:hypothetical protein
MITTAWSGNQRLSLMVVYIAADTCEQNVENINQRGEEWLKIKEDSFDNNYYYNSSSSESFNSISLSAALFLGSPYSSIATPLLVSCPYVKGKNLLTDLYLACFLLIHRSFTATHTRHKTMSSATQSTRERRTIRIVRALP